MGASGWEHFVPYQQDIAMAFRELQHREYQQHYEGRVSRSQTIAELRAQIDDPDFTSVYSDPEDQESVRETINEHIQRLEALPLPTNIDEQIVELRSVSMEEGTGSILDMDGISGHEEYFKIAPISTSELVRIFGTDKPNHDMVVAKSIEVMRLRRSQKGSYLIIYKDDQADEIYFCGFSGD